MINIKHKFKYFQNPEKNARYIDEPCEVCGSNNLCLNGTYFDHYEDELESICMDCLVQGKVVVKFPNFLYTRIYDEVKKENQNSTEEQIKNKIDTIFSVLEKTPPIPWIQYNDWPVCCGDFMTYLEELGRDNLNLMATNGDGKSLLFDLLDEETKSRVEDLEALWNDLEDYDIAYHFKCEKCGKERVIIQNF